MHIMHMGIDADTKVIVLVVIEGSTEGTSIKIFEIIPHTVIADIMQTDTSDSSPSSRFAGIAKSEYMVILRS